MRQLKITQQITARNQDSLERYLSDIAKEPMITPDEEVRLAKLIKTGDTDALEKMTKANLRFVVTVAKQYQNQGLSLSDLINEGNLGLIKAAQRFDETKGFKFISYAVWWIRQSILQALTEHSRMVRLPLNKIGSFSKISKLMTRFENKFEREPTNEEMAELMDVGVKDIEEMLKGLSRHVSIDAPINDEEDPRTMADFMIDEEQKEGADDLFDKESLKIDIERIFRNMRDQREARILSCYFGVNGEKPMSLEDIGLRFNLTRERVRQVKERAIRRLRNTAGKKLNKYLGK